MLFSKEIVCSVFADLFLFFIFVSFWPLLLLLRVVWVDFVSSLLPGLFRLPLVLRWNHRSIRFWPSLLVLVMTLALNWPLAFAAKWENKSQLLSGKEIIKDTSISSKYVSIIMLRLLFALKKNLFQTYRGCQIF